MRVLVIGGGGLLGSHLTPKLMDDGHEVVICDNLTGCVEHRLLPGVRLFTANAADYNALQHVFSVFKPEAVFVAAAHYFSRDTIYRFFDDTRLVLDSANAIAALLDKNVKHVYFCSTSEIYGGPQTKRPLKESRKVGLSATNHGTAKLAAERVLEFRCNELGIGYTSLRIFDMFGPRILFCSRTGVINFLIDAFLRNESVGLVGAKKLRDFIHVDDVAKACIGLLNKGFSGTINIGTGVGTTLIDVVQGLSKSMDIAEKPAIIPKSKTEIFSAVADVSLLTSVLPNWSPEIGVIDSLPTLIDFRVQEAERFKGNPAAALDAIRGIGSV